MGRSPSSAGPMTELDFQEVVNRTVPKDGRLVAASQLVRNNFGLRATWDVETNSDDHTYCRWLKSQFIPAYHVTTDTASTITFVKETRGDSYSLEFTSRVLKNLD